MCLWRMYCFTCRCCIVIFGHFCWLKAPVPEGEGPCKRPAAERRPCQCSQWCGPVIWSYRHEDGLCEQGGQRGQPPLLLGLDQLTVYFNLRNSTQYALGSVFMLYRCYTWHILCLRHWIELWYYYYVSDRVWGGYWCAALVLRCVARLWNLCCSDTSTEKGVGCCIRACSSSAEAAHSLLVPSLCWYRCGVVVCYNEVQNWSFEYHFICIMFCST